MATNKLATQRRQVSNYLTTPKQLLADYYVKMTAAGAGQITHCAGIYFRRSEIFYTLLEPSPVLFGKKSNFSHRSCVLLSNTYYR